MIRKALFSETEVLSEIAFRSKAYWGYSAEFMEACRAELSITTLYLEHHSTFVLERDATAIGFYTLERLSSTEVELGHLFVEPDEIGRGYGGLLIAHACEQARVLHYRTLVIQSDPGAEGFYIASGARRVSSKQSLSVRDRSLPLLELESAAT